jgi:hypothetical protein
MAVVAGGGLAAYHYCEPVSATILTAGLIVGALANPDVRDQENVTNYAEGKVYQWFGQEYGYLWELYWYPLANSIPHRHWLSHLPGPATAIAAIWLYGPWLWMLWLYDSTLLNAALAACMWTLPGWVVQDYVHLYLDGGFKAIRW